MSKFKIGDKVKRNAKFYGLDDNFMYLGKECIVVEILDHTYLKVEGSDYEYNEHYFDLVQKVSKFQAMKFRVENEEHSRKIQEHLFSLGYEWHYEGKKVRNVNAVRIYTNTSGLLGWATKSDLYNEDCSYVEYILKESTTYSLEKAPVESPITQQINIDGQALTEQDVRDLIAFKKLMQEQLDKFGGK